MSQSNTDNKCPVQEVRDPYQAFRDQLAGYPDMALPSNHTIVVNGMVQRYGSVGKPKKKNNWYILFDLPLDSGEVILAGTFGSFASGIKVNVDLTVPELSVEEKKRFAKRQDETAKAAVKAKADRQKTAADKALKLYASLPDQGVSAYLNRKKVSAYGLRFSRGAIYIPLRNATGELVGMQYIDSKGSKIFFSGTAKQGAFHLVGLAHHGAVQDLKIHKVIFAEGYATAVSLYQAYKGAVPAVVAFDAENLVQVVGVFRDAFPSATFLIGADNDIETLKPVVNPGLVKAKAAAAKYGCKFVVPSHPVDPNKNADWNDVHVLGGLGLIRKQISEQLLGGSCHA